MLTAPRNIPHRPAGLVRCDEFAEGEPSVRAGGLTREPPRSAERNTHAQANALPVVRRPGGGGGAVLLLGLPELEDHRRRPVREGRTGTRGRRDGGGVRARRTAVRRPQRRPPVHLRRGDLVPDRLRVTGGGRPLLVRPVEGRRGGALRVAQGPLRAVLAGRATA